MSHRNDALEDLVHVDFCSAAKRVLDVLPVEDENVHRALGDYISASDANSEASEERERLPR